MKGNKKMETLRNRLRELKAKNVYEMTPREQYEMAILQALHSEEWKGYKDAPGYDDGADFMNISQALSDVQIILAKEVSDFYFK